MVEKSSLTSLPHFQTKIFNYSGQILLAHFHGFSDNVVTLIRIWRHSRDGRYDDFLLNKTFLSTFRGSRRRRRLSKVEQPTRRKKKLMKVQEILLKPFSNYRERFCNRFNILFIITHRIKVHQQTLESQRHFVSKYLCISRVDHDQRKWAVSEEKYWVHHGLWGPFKFRVC